MVNSEPGRTGFESAAADVFSWCTHSAVTQAVQNGEIMTTETYNRFAPHIKNDQYVKVDACNMCKQSIKPSIFFLLYVLKAYNKWRDWCGFRQATSFDDLTDIPDYTIRRLLEKLYESVLINIPT